MMLGRRKRKKKQGPYYQYLRIAAIVFSAAVTLLVVYFATKAWLADVEKKNAQAGAATPLPSPPAGATPAPVPPADSGQSRNEATQGPELAMSAESFDLRTESERWSFGDAPLPAPTWRIV